MISVRTFFRTIILYGDFVSLADKFKLSQFTSFTGEKCVKLMKTQCRRTVFIDLKKSEEEILMDFKSNTRNEVRRAIKDGYLVEEVYNPEEFISFYNSFASERNLPSINLNHVKKWKSFRIYKSIFNDNVLSMHVTIFDEELKIARLLYSASARFNECTNRKEVGISNRYLHYWEFTEFKRLGYVTYDFAGVTDDPEETELYNISNFKRSFGGVEEDVYFLYSYPLYIVLKFKNILKNFINKSKK